MHASEVVVCNIHTKPSSRSVFQKQLSPNVNYVEIPQTR